MTSGSDKTSECRAGEPAGRSDPSAARGPVSPHRSETVVNPEGRAVRAVGRPAGASEYGELWRRLFPPENEVLEGRAPNPAGIELAHFRIEERIGMGGMGAVFRALDTRLQRYVALKVLSPFQARDPAAVQRFLNEARAAARLDHDNIARVYYIGEDKGLNFIAFEFITGTNVRDLIERRGRLDPAEAVNYTLQIASALRHTSAAGVIHRDIKPSNIIITPTGRAKLVDLGLARKVDSESAADITVAGTTLGTFDYISPEQAKDPRNVDVRSDIYSLGCTLYHMLTGEPPYAEGTVLQKLLNHQSSEPPDPAKKRPGIPPALSAVVRKMMASDPRDRYASPDELIQDLMVVAGSLGLRGIHPEGLVWVSPEAVRGSFWERNLGWILAAAVLVLIVVALQRFPQLGQAIPTAETGPVGPTATDQSGQPAVSGQGSSSQSGPTSSGTTDQRAARAHSLDSRPPTTPEASSSPTSGRPTGSTGGPAPAPTGSTSSASPTNAPSPTSTTSPAPAAASASDSGVDSGEATRLIQPGWVDEPSTTEPSLFDGAPDVQPLVSPTLEGWSDGESPPATAPPGQVPAESAGQSSSSESTNGSFESADAGTAVLPPMPETGPLAAEDPTPVCVLGSGGAVVKRYATVNAACAEVADGQVIELRFDGVRREKPLRIAGRSVTIRAARGFRPVLEFELPGAASETTAAAVTLLAGSLAVNNVELRLALDAENDLSRASVFELVRPEQVRLRGVVVTVASPTRQRVAMFHFASEGEGVGEPEAGGTVVQVELTNCLLRGETDVFSVQGSVLCQLALRNTAVVVDGSLLRLFGSTTVSDGSAVDLLLEHCTGLLGNNLLQIDCDDLSQELPAVRVVARDNVFSSPFSSPLILVQGNFPPEEAARLIAWTGERNYFDRYDVLWRCSSGAEVSTMDDWQQLWKDGQSEGSNNAGVRWKRPVFRGDFSAATVEDFLLDPRFADTAVATDGSDVGVDAALLPRPLQSPTSSSTP